MKRILRWTTIRINRRTVLRGATTAAFGALAAVAVGRPATAVVIGPCSSPYGGGACPPTNCSGTTCRDYGLTLCGPLIGYCFGSTTSACWSSSSGGTCCDCMCFRESTHEWSAPGSGGNPPLPPRSWACYCYA
jgi:hypothetical protein